MGKKTHSKHHEGRRCAHTPTLGAWSDIPSTCSGCSGATNQVETVANGGHSNGSSSGASTHHTLFSTLVMDIIQLLALVHLSGMIPTSNYLTIQAQVDKYVKQIGNDIQDISNNNNKLASALGQCISVSDRDSKAYSTIAANTVLAQDARTTLNLLLPLIENAKSYISATGSAAVDACRYALLVRKLNTVISTGDIQLDYITDKYPRIAAGLPLSQ